jgi:hypothetical protein
MLNGGMSLNAIFIAGHVSPQAKLSTTSISFAFVSCDWRFTWHLCGFQKADPVTTTRACRSPLASHRARELSQRRLGL